MAAEPVEVEVAAESNAAEALQVGLGRRRLPASGGWLPRPAAVLGRLTLAGCRQHGAAKQPLAAYIWCGTLARGTVWCWGPATEPVGVAFAKESATEPVCDRASLQQSQLATEPAGLRQSQFAHSLRQSQFATEPGVLVQPPGEPRQAMAVKGFFRHVTPWACAPPVVHPPASLRRLVAPFSSGSRAPDPGQKRSSRQLGALEQARCAAHPAAHAVLLMYYR